MISRSPLRSVRFAIAWNEIPPYACDLIASLKDTDYWRDTVVIATAPRIPFRGHLELLNENLVLVPADKRVSWSELNCEIPAVFFQASWVYKPFNSLGMEVKGCGGKVVGLFDNCDKGSIRQSIGALLFRFVLGAYFDRVWVPGASGMRLAKKWGFNSENIFTGLYGVSSTKFSGKDEIRRKRFLYVGQLIERKGLDLLIEAFVRLRQSVTEWELVVCGTGPLDERHFGGVEGVRFLGFRQQDEIANLMRESFCFVLASREDHWPLVICEAAQAGCGLVLSDRVGNREELLVDGRNGFPFKSEDVGSLRDALEGVISLWSRGADVANFSRTAGRVFSSEHWAQRFRAVCESLSGGVI